MRVAYISQAPFVSGAERSLQTMLRALPAAGVEPIVVCPPDAKIIPWCEQNAVPYFRCPLACRDKWHLLRWWRSVRQMRSVLRDQRIDLVHSNTLWSYPPAGAAGRDLGLPRVCHMRDEVSAEATRWCCAAGVEAVLCISRHIEQHVSAAWPTNGRPWMSTLLNPVTLPRLGSAADEANARRLARGRLGVREDAVVFGFIGQIVPVKGVVPLLRALAELKGDTQWHFLAAGRDPNPGAPHEVVCLNEVKALGLGERVTFCGYLEEAESFFRAIDVAVVPSLEEPLGRVPLEAGSYARPSIAFATGGLPETIRPGETGWLVPTGDVAALRQALVDFLDRPAAQAGRAARLWVEEVSDPRTYVTRLKGVYDRLTAAMARPA